MIKGISRTNNILDRLLALHPKLIDLSLDRLKRLLVNLGNPEEFLPPTIHVAGTNGKGSVVAYLRAMFESAGKKVHVYTSPHLVNFHERIRVSGQIIPDYTLSQHLERCEEVNNGAPITFFEITTAAAFLAFSTEPADLLLLETGLGGRLDATNVIKNPKTTIITPISLDHQQFLGDDLGKIAGEKAGIIKAGVPLVLAKQNPESDSVIRARANKLGALVYGEGSDWTVESRFRKIIYTGASGEFEFPPPNLVGAHQVRNAGIALATIEKFEGMCVENPSIKKGLISVDWPARLQNLTDDIIEGILSKDTELWLDGGHNLAAGIMLANHANTEWKDRPLYIIIGMMKTKDILGFLHPFVNVDATIYTVSIPGELNSLSSTELSKAAKCSGLETYPCDNLGNALERIRSLRQKSKRILICGSLYLAGSILASEFYQPK